MNIVTSDNNVSMQGKWSWVDKCKKQIKRAKQKCFDVLPEYTQKESQRTRDNMKKCDDFISNPMWNRGIMGITALATQPAIDYYNHRVDDETRTVSRNRTISKILAGTLVGMFVVRGPIYKMVEKMTDIKGVSKYSKALLPKNYIEEISKNPKFLANHRSTIAMLLALIAMTVTNFVLDAPLTIFFTNYLNEKSGIKNNEQKRITRNSKEGRVKHE